MELATPAMPPAQQWKQSLDVAARKAKAELIGTSLIAELHHARLLITCLAAFGDDPRAVIYVEGRASGSAIPRPDLILVHPDVGVLVLENKGVDIQSIHRVDNTLLTLVRDGQLKEEDPFRQAERVMFSLRDLASQRMDITQALLLSTAALPRIPRDHFTSRFDSAQAWQTAVFAEEAASSDLLRKHILSLAQAEQRRTGRATILSRHARDTLLAILNGKAFLTAPRRSYIDSVDRDLVGVQVQEMELALKEPTQQQREIGRKDLRGSHWLFRGVAGSGKSLMLALSVATTLSRFEEEASGLLFRSAPKRVLVVCFNRTLVHYLRQRIEERFARLAWHAPGANALRITHMEELIRELERSDPSLRTPFDFNEKGRRALAMTEAFDRLPPATREALQYDAIYIDEAQDLEPEEFPLLLRLAASTPDGGQTFVVFYDNAQNIYGKRPPVWSQLGVGIKGRTNFLDVCLRNTQEVLAVAFNVLIGAFADESTRVATRGFADLESLRERGLVKEEAGRIHIDFAQRTGAVPYVREYPSRDAEIAAAAEIVRRLIHNHKVVPSDILILYKSHHAYGQLRPRLREILDAEPRLVDSAHNAEKNLPLIIDGVLTCSTIASAKGYDAPIVLLLGVDELALDTEDRALFYVGATRAKLNLIVTGVAKDDASLLREALLAARTFATETADALTLPTPKPSDGIPAAPAVPVIHPEPRRDNRSRCSHCGSPRLHAQQGGNGYYFICIDCTRTTPISRACPVCSARAYIRKKGRQFLRKCSRCRSTELLHTNIPLDSLFQ